MKLGDARVYRHRFRRRDRRVIIVAHHVFRSDASQFIEAAEVADITHCGRSVLFT